MNNSLQKLKTSLCDAIDNWLTVEAGKGAEYDELDTYIGGNISELMTDAAFAVLLSQRDLTKYLRENEITEP
jgi:hypothetical protein